MFYNALYLVRSLKDQLENEWTEARRDEQIWRRIHTLMQRLSAIPPDVVHKESEKEKLAFGEV